MVTSIREWRHLARKEKCLALCGKDFAIEPRYTLEPIAWEKLGYLRYTYGVWFRVDPQGKIIEGTTHERELLVEKFPPDATRNQLQALTEESAVVIREFSQFLKTLGEGWRGNSNYTIQIISGNPTKYRKTRVDDYKFVNDVKTLIA